jgi:hypothetical protein
MKNKGATLIELLVIIVIVGSILGLIGVGIGGCSVSDGSRVGTITKFSHKGVVWKTYEGELNCGGLKNSLGSDGKSSMVSNLWEFSVAKDNKEIIDKIQSAMDKNIPVKLTYHQYFVVMPWTADTDYLITEVKEVQ